MSIAKSAYVRNGCSDTHRALRSLPCSSAVHSRENRRSNVRRKSTKEVQVRSRRHPDSHEPDAGEMQRRLTIQFSLRSLLTEWVVASALRFVHTVHTHKGFPKYSSSSMFNPSSLIPQNTSTGNRQQDASGFESGESRASASVDSGAPVKPSTMLMDGTSLHE